MQMSKNGGYYYIFRLQLTLYFGWGLITQIDYIPKYHNKINLMFFF